MFQVHCRHFIKSQGKNLLLGKSRSSLLNNGVKMNNAIIGSWRTTTTTTTTLTASSSFQIPKIVGIWLGGCAGMCMGAVIIGGLTRLTESGLSMVDWKLLGRPPPKDEASWKEEFRKYSTSPEYIHKNSNITMEEFKFIWMMEYGHRMWGRTIGAVFYIPAAIFWAKGFLDKAMKKRVLIAGTLLAGQGLLGWYMVKSGLKHENFQGPNDVPRVSQYRLASHLSAAMVLYSFLFWNSLSVLKPAIAPTNAFNIPKDVLKFRKLAMGCKTLVFFTAVSGAFVAGLDAGLVYNSFPKMSDKWIPTDILAYSPWLSNFTENPTTVQFDHRVLGTSTLALITFTAFKGLTNPVIPHPIKAAAAGLLIAGWGQVGLGISTLLNYVPVHLAAMHQSGAIVTLSMALWLSHELKLMKVLKKIPK